ncbi:MAG TPA: hypothetical protein VFS00_08370 [Polyangiaceae bacterium]|nr:hypothetical protein [Polyangiaceae bacterium]
MNGAVIGERRRVGEGLVLRPTFGRIPGNGEESAEYGLTPNDVGRGGAAC